MKYIYRIFVFLIVFSNLSYCVSFDNENVISEKEKSKIIDLIVNNSNLEPMRNSEGVVPIDEFTSLISISKAGNPAYILSRYILNTSAMKLYLVPLVTATNEVDFRKDLDLIFYAGLETYKSTFLKSDIDNFCNPENESIVMSLGINIKKEYLNEDNELLFSTNVSSSSCFEDVVNY